MASYHEFYTDLIGARITDKDFRAGLEQWLWDICCFDNDGVHYMSPDARDAIKAVERTGLELRQMYAGKPWQVWGVTLH